MLKEEDEKDHAEMHKASWDCGGDQDTSACYWAYPTI